MNNSIIRKKGYISALCGKAGRTGIALLLAVSMLLLSLPMNAGGLEAYAEGTDCVHTHDAQCGYVPASEGVPCGHVHDDACGYNAESGSVCTHAHDAQCGYVPASEGVPCSHVCGAECGVTVDVQIPSQIPVSDADIAEVSSADAEKHICIVHGFKDNTPGQPYDTLEVAAETTISEIKALLPDTLVGIMGCEDCPDKVSVKWKASEQGGSAYRFTVTLDEQLYSYVVLDDPTTEDIDESRTSPYCDLPYITVNVKQAQNSITVTPSDAVPAPGVSSSDVVSSADVSGSDVSASDASSSDISGTDVSGSDTVTSSDVSGSDVSGSDVSASDVHESDKGGVSSENEVLPLCTCAAHCYANADAGMYLVDINCSVCSMDPTACLKAPELAENVLEATAADGRQVTVAGELPAGAVLSVEPVPYEQVVSLLGGDTASDVSDIYFAYDIKILYEGHSFQPSDYDRNVVVSVYDIGAECIGDVDIYHIDGDKAEKVDAQLDEDSTVSFETDGFSLYTGVRAATLSAVYMYRDSSNNCYFYYDSARSSRVEKNGTPYSSIESLLSDYATDDLTIYLQGTYLLHSNETIDGGTDRTVTITRDPSYASKENGIDVGHIGSGAYTLTLRNVTLNGNYDSLKNEEYAMIYVRNGGKLNIQDGARLINSYNHAIWINNGTVNMSGGEISGNKAIDDTDSTKSSSFNGAGLFIDEDGVFNMSGGVIKNNEAKHSGGGVWNDGTMTMTGGSIINNSCSYHGGGIICHGSSTTFIKGGVISGNKAADNASNDNGDGIVVYNNNEVTETNGTTPVNTPHLIMTGSPMITDMVTLAVPPSKLTNSNKDLSVCDPFTPQSIINLAFWNQSGVADLSAYDTNGGFKAVTTYSNEGYTSSGNARTPTAADARKFALADPQYFLESDGQYCLKVSKASGIAYYKAGASGDGSSPSSPTSSLSAAYSRLASTGGTVYMLSAYTPANGETLSSTKCGSVSASKPIQLKRYVRPNNMTSWPATYAGSLIVVNSGVTFSMGNVSLDGHNRRAENIYGNNADYTAEALSEATAAMVVVNGGGTLNLNDNAVLKNAPASAQGGALYVSGGATVNVNNGATFSYNSGSTANGFGKNIYVAADNSVVNLSGNIAMEGGDVYLASENGKVNITDDAFTTEDGVLDITLGAAAHCPSGRVVAAYTGGTPNLAELLVSNADVSAFNTQVSDQNVILSAYEAVLTALPEGVTAAEGQSGTYNADLAQMFEMLGTTAKTVDLSASAADITLVDYTTVDTNKSEWGSADANTKFGLSAAVGGSTVNAVNGSFSASAATVLAIDLHNANALAEKAPAGVITLDLTIDGYVRTVTITVNTVSGQIDASVPLRIYGVVDSMGNFTLPSADAYKITNNSMFPLEVKEIKWSWESGASALFTNPDSMSSSVRLGENTNLYTFKTGVALINTINGGRISAQTDGVAGTLGLTWAMNIGENNRIKSTTTQHVATIQYTIEVAD